jgi:hypothetical protein
MIFRVLWCGHMTVSVRPLKLTIQRACSAQPSHTEMTHREMWFSIGFSCMDKDPIRGQGVYEAHHFLARTRKLCLGLRVCHPTLSITSERAGKLVYAPLPKPPSPTNLQDDVERCKGISHVKMNRAEGKTCEQEARQDMIALKTVPSLRSQELSDVTTNRASGFL